MTLASRISSDLIVRTEYIFTKYAKNLREVIGALHDRKCVSDGDIGEIGLLLRPGKMLIVLFIPTWSAHVGILGGSS